MVLVGSALARSADEDAEALPRATGLSMNGYRKSLIRHCKARAARSGMILDLCARGVAIEARPLDGRGLLVNAH